MSSTKPLTSTNAESVLSQGTGCTSSILVTRSTLTCGNVTERRANARRVHKTLVSLALILALAGALVLAYGMHQRANAAPVQPTWQQGVVTVDDERVVELAQQWGAPFRVEFAADADVKVSRVDLTGAGMAGGDLRGVAEVAADGDRITGCTLRLDRVRATDATIVHEFGHCIGVDHLYTEQSRSVMVKGGVEDREHGSATVTEFDRVALAGLYGN